MFCRHGSLQEFLSYPLCLCLCFTLLWFFLLTYISILYFTLIVLFPVYSDFSPPRFLITVHHPFSWLPVACCCLVGQRQGGLLSFFVGVACHYSLSPQLLLCNVEINHKQYWKRFLHWGDHEWRVLSDDVTAPSMSWILLISDSESSFVTAILVYSCALSLWNSPVLSMEFCSSSAVGRSRAAG